MDFIASLQQPPKAGFLIADLHFLSNRCGRIPLLALGFIVPGCLVVAGFSGDARQQRLWRNHSYCQQREAKVPSAGKVQIKQWKIKQNKTKQKINVIAGLLQVLPAVPHWPGCPSTF